MAESSSPTLQRKHYFPLESNPEVFTQLIHELGVSQDLVFQDVYSLDDPDLLAFIPRPALALVLVFPTISDNFTKQKAASEAKREVYEGKGEGEDVVWFKQTIGNACGLYAILHAISNGEARTSLSPDTLFGRLLAQCIPLPPLERALALQNSSELERAHHAAATQGDSAVPQSAEDDVDFHYVCFVKSHKNGHLYEMDGDTKGPIDRGLVLKEEEDVLSGPGLEVIREYIKREGDGNLNFGLMALVYGGED